MSTKETEEHTMSKNQKSAAAVIETVVPVVQVALDDKNRKKVVDVSKESLEAKGLKTKSAVIRYLSAENYSPSAIAKFMDIRYQHVRNVLNQKLKKSAE